MASKKPSLWGAAGTTALTQLGPSAMASPLAADYALTSGVLEGLPFAAPSAAGGAGLTGGALGSTLGTAGIGAGAATGYLQAQGAMNAIKGDKLSLLEETALALPTFGTSFLFDKFGSGKDKDQQVRDKWRSVMQDAGALDDDYNITNADGGKFDLGKDGKTKNYNIDWSKEDAGSKVGLLDPLGDLTTSGDKARSDAVGQMYNAANSSGDFGENIKKYYADAGYTHETAYQGILDKYKDKTDAESVNRRDAELASLDRLYGTGQKAQASAGDGKGSGGHTTTIVVKPEDTTFLPNIGVTPTQSTPAPVLEPDDEPTTEEQSSVDQYASLLKKKLKETKAK